MKKTLASTTRPRWGSRTPIRQWNGQGPGIVFRSKKKKAARKLRDELIPRASKTVKIAQVMRLLKTVRDLKGRAWVVGGVVTEGYTRRDIDIVVTDMRDIPKITKALGSLASIVHFIPQKTKPPAPILLEITGVGPEKRPAK